MFMMDILHTGSKYVQNALDFQLCFITPKTHYLSASPEIGVCVLQTRCGSPVYSLTSCVSLQLISPSRPNIHQDFPWVLFSKASQWGCLSLAWL